jgi:hypothetical protein
LKISVGENSCAIAFSLAATTLSRTAGKGGSRQRAG